MHRDRSWRLGHRPALDGLRGIAILLVLLAHFDNPRTNPLTGAGAVGVTVFFTLSGFLITSLLIEERDRSGRVSLRGFYRRRALRLLPALYATVLVTLIAQAYWHSMSVPPDLAGTVLLSVSNWWLIGNGFNSALGHTWSLGIEEQFYLLWPALLLLSLRWGRRGATYVLVGGITLSVISVLVPGGDPMHGSIERAASLLAGCALAVWMTSRPEGRAHPLVAASALSAMAPLLWLDGSLDAGWYVLGVPVLTVVVLWAVASGESPSWLSGSVLRWFGRRSYGIYLWHYPVLFAFAISRHDPWQWPMIWRLALSLVIAELSWRLIEHPFQQLRSRHPRDAAKELEPSLALGGGSERRREQPHVGSGHRLGRGRGRLEPGHSVR